MVTSVQTPLSCIIAPPARSSRLCAPVGIAIFADQLLRLGRHGGKARDALSAQVHASRIVGVVDLDACGLQVFDQTDYLQSEKREYAGALRQPAKCAVDAEVVVVARAQNL